MAIIRIKEGSFTIEVLDDDGSLVLLARTVDLGKKPPVKVTFDGAEVQVLMENPGGQHLPHVAAYLNGSGQGKSKISRK